METLCKTCCNGACPLQVTKDRLIVSCIEYIPGMMIGEIADRLKENELASEANPVKRGRWLPKSEDDIYEFSECSECGNIESCETPYCAQCGARMEGDTE